MPEDGPSATLRTLQHINSVFFNMVKFGRLLGKIIKVSYVNTKQIIRNLINPWWLPRIIYLRSEAIHIEQTNKQTCITGFQQETEIQIMWRNRARQIGKVCEQIALDTYTNSLT